jgi:SAM-dependent methyltransferase
MLAVCAANQRREQERVSASTAPDGYSSDAVRQVYQDMAAGYAVRFGDELSDPDPDTDFLDAALADLPPGPVLDVGCGPGQVGRYLLARGRKPVGIDLAPGMLAEAAKLVPGARLLAADLLDLPLRAGSCAAVVASYSLHHLPKARFGPALSGLRDVLAPGGVLVIITHGGSGEQWLEQFGGRVVLSLYAPDELASLLSGSGLVPEIMRSRPPRPGEYPADKIRISARRPG